MSNQSTPTQSDRRRTIEVIKTPLHFYALALLIVEAFLGMVLIFSDLTPVDKMRGMYIGVGLFVLVIFIVTLFVARGAQTIIYPPETLYRERARNSLIDFLESQGRSALLDEIEVEPDE